MKRLAPYNEKPAHALLMKSVVITGALCVALSGGRQAFGAENKLTPALEIREEFIDNVYLTSDNKKSDYLTVLMPSLTFARSADGAYYDLMAALNWQSYADTHGNSTGYSFRGMTTQSLSERFDLGLNSSYVLNTGPSSINQTTGLSTNSDWYSQSYAAYLKRILDELTTATLSYSFSQDTYDSGLYLDMTAHKAGLQLSRDLGKLAPTLKGFFSADFTRALYKNSDIDNYSLRVGGSGNLYEKVDLSLSVGGRYSNSTYRQLHPLLGTISEQVSNDWGAVGSAALTYSGERDTGSLSFSHDFTAGSGTVGGVVTTSFNLLLRHGFSEKLTGQLSGSYIINTSSSGQFSARSSDTRAYTISTDLGYKVTQNCTLGVQYSYYEGTQGNTNSYASQNRVMLHIIAAYPVIF